MIVDLSKKSLGVGKMSGDDNSLDGTGSVASSAGDRAQDRSLESDSNINETCADHVTDVCLEKLDKVNHIDRELLAKIKQHEKEERLEIERGLKEQEDVLRDIKRHGEMRYKDFRHADKIKETEIGQDLRVNKSEKSDMKIDREMESDREDYKSLRENVLKGYISPAMNIYNHPAYLAAMSAATAGYPRSPSPESTTSTTPPLGDGPSHHWTFEEQFKQEWSMEQEKEEDKEHAGLTYIQQDTEVNLKALIEAIKMENVERAYV